MQRTVVWVTTQFEAYHSWTEAPEEVAFLRYPHRHVFHVKLGVEVSHGDRDIEFFILKRKLRDYINDTLTGRTTTWSCEYMATMIVIAMHGAWCEVSEDGENGAWVEGLPACRKKTKCFVGTECEGPHAGDFAFFVPGSVTPDRFQRAWTAYLVDHRMPNRIYYGAGNDHALRADTLRSIFTTATNVNNEGYSTVGVDVEVAGGECSSQLMTLLRDPTINCIGVKGYVGGGECRWVKRVTHNTIYWHEYDNTKPGLVNPNPAYHTPIDHEAFNNDVDVE